MKRLFFILLLAASFVYADDDDYAMQTVERVTQTIAQELTDKQFLIGQHPGYQQKLISDELLPVVDEQFMARKILGEHWKRASLSQQRSFILLMRERIVSVYGSAFDGFIGGAIEFHPAKYSKDDKKADVYATITRADDVLTLGFHLYKIRHQWQVSDLIVGGVSFVRSFHEQVVRNIDQNGLAQTISILNNEYPDPAPVLKFGAQSWGAYMAPGQPNQGLAVDIVNNAFAVLGYRTDITFLSETSIEDKTADGELIGDIAVWRSQEPDKDYLYSDPYLMNKLVFVKRNEDPFTYKNQEQMRDFIRGKGYRLGLYYGVDYGPDIQEKLGGFIIDRRDYCSQLLRDVANKSLDLALVDHWAGTLEIRQKTTIADQIILLDDPIGERSMHLRVKSSSPEAKRIIDAFNTGLAAIRENGTYMELLKLHKYSQ